MNATISDDALDLIVTEEDSGETYYTRHYQHFEWPQGASGPTIGIGYDCGYVTTAQARVDWEGFVSPDTIEAIVKACGLKGQAAAAFVRAHGASVTITWDQAIAQFKGRELPQWLAKVQAALPNTGKLSPTASAHWCRSPTIAAVRTICPARAMRRCAPSGPT